VIPEEKSAAVTRGLREAFGADAFEDIRALTTSLRSDPVFRIVVAGSPFLLRIVTRTGDPARLIQCMRAGAEAGLAPRVRYAGSEDRIAITDFVEAAPFPVADALLRMPAALRTLHALPPFPAVPNRINTSCTFFLGKGPEVEGFIRKFQSAGLVPEGESREVFARYEQVTAAYSSDEADLASSHNDLKPANILFDGRRVWLVDWEAAFLNDRYADLAAVANFVVSNEAEEKAYLQEYFGQAPDAGRLARFFLMRQLSHLFYAMAYLLLGASGNAANEGARAPGFTDFQRRVWAGEVDMADRAVRAVYGRVHWERLLENLRQPRFREALSIVSELRARS